MQKKAVKNEAALRYEKYENRCYEDDGEFIPSDKCIEFFNKKGYPKYHVFGGSKKSKIKGKPKKGGSKN